MPDLSQQRWWFGDRRLRLVAFRVDSVHFEYLQPSRDGCYCITYHLPSYQSWAPPVRVADNARAYHCPWSDV